MASSTITLIFHERVTAAQAQAMVDACGATGVTIVRATLANPDGRAVDIQPPIGPNREVAAQRVRERMGLALGAETDKKKRKELAEEFAYIEAMARAGVKPT